MTIIVAVIAVLGIIVWAVAQPPAVECIALASSVQESTFNEMGEVIPQQESDIFSKSGGKIVDVIIAEGMAVRRGDLLFVFDDADLRSEEEGILGEISVVDSQIKSQIVSLETQKNSLESEKATVQIQVEKAYMEEQKLSGDIKSAELLHEFGDIPAQDVHNARFAYDLAVKNRELAAAQLAHLTAQISTVNTQINDLRLGQNPETANGASQRQQLLAQKAALEIGLGLLRDKQSEIEVFSAQDGIIRDITVKEGQIIAPGSKLCSVYQPEQYRVDCFILVENTEGVKSGDEVGVTLQMRHEDKKFTGTITRLAHDAVDRISKVGLSEKRIKAEITVTAEGWENVGPYWPVEVRFVTSKTENCLLVPKTALFEDAGNVWKVWAVRDGKLLALAVERGIQTPSQTEIKGDINPGEIIVKDAKAGNIVEGKKIKCKI